MKKLLFTTIFISTAIFFSCSKKSAGVREASSAAIHQQAKSVDAAFTGTGYNPEIMEEADEAGESKSSIQPTNRKIIYTGSISLEVKSLEQTQNDVQKWVNDFGGYIAEVSMGSRLANFTAKIPAASFTNAMEQAASFGSILHKQIQTSDVTDEFYDLKTRLETKKVMLDRLQTYLKNASAIKDMIEIETKINEVTSDFEAMQGQMNRLSSRIDFATVTISATLPPNRTEEGFAFPDARGKAKTLFGDLLGFLVNLFFILLYIVFYGIPIILALALFYWLCFGKVGLLRKLFQKISVRKNKE